MCVCLVWALFAMHLFFPIPLLCQSLCVICRQLEVCGNRDLLLFSHMPLSTHPSSFLLSRHLCLFVCLHVKAVALVSLTHTHSPSSYYVSQHSSFSCPLTQGDVHWAVTESKDKHLTNHTHHKLDCYHSWYEFSRGFTLTTAGNDYIDTAENTIVSPVVYCYVWYFNTIWLGIFNQKHSLKLPVWVHCLLGFWKLTAMVIWAVWLLRGLNPVVVHWSCSHQFCGLGETQTLHSTLKY